MAEPCEHKPTIGCVLTALPGCCACTDRRPVATAYPIYIDGQGMRLQGKRWQRYCWKCRDYWNLQSQSQSQLQSQSQSTSSHSLSIDRQNTEFSTAPNPPGDGQQDDMDRRFPYRPYGAPPGPPTWSFGQNPDPQQANRHNPFYPVTPQTPLPPQLSTPHTADVNVHPEAGSQRHVRYGYQPNRPNFGHNFVESGTTRRRRRPVVNPFGTREEIESEDYQSPVAGLFGRAWNRYREAQEAGQAAATQAEGARRTLGDVNLLGTGPPRSDGVDLDTAMALSLSTYPRNEMADLMAAVAELQANQPDTPHAHPQVNPIDQQASRPRPLEVQDMTISIACKICCEQKVDTLLEPCMHVAICHWCSELVRELARQRRRQHLPRTDEDRWRCPICRREVTNARKVYLV